MRKGLVAWLIGICVLATSASAMPDRASLLAAIEEHGCALSFTELGVIAESLGFENHGFELLLDELVAEGVLEPSGEVFALRTEKCR